MERRELVTARNEIQVLLLNLLQCPVRDRRSPEWQLSVGAAFSLWRAVFLVPPKDVGRSNKYTADTAGAFLERVVRTNAIAFNDDLRNREWVSGYYLNNARYRLAELLGEPLERGVGHRTTRLWNRYFHLLSQRVRTKRSSSLRRRTRTRRRRRTA